MDRMSVSNRRTPRASDPNKDKQTNPVSHTSELRSGVIYDSWKITTSGTSTAPLPWGLDNI